MKTLIIFVTAMVILAGCNFANNGQKTMKDYRAVAVEDLNVSPAKIIGQEWMLITAGKLGEYNTMTASWGQMGHLWGKNVATMYIRPGRYTKEFVDNSDIFTLSFFKEKYRNAMNICGSKSGRDVDKIKEAGLTPFATPAGSVAFEEAYMIVECRKLYAAPLLADAFTDAAIVPQMYQQGDFHTMYVGEILNVYIK
jgi:flavin reductase (DIM6/NTAB) family NADH-FMN oxidoreductase RutF